MTTRRKTPGHTTMAALSLAAALAVPTGPALAQQTGHPPEHIEDIALPADDESSERPDSDAECDVIWCWPLHVFIPCWFG